MRYMFDTCLFPHQRVGLALMQIPGLGKGRVKTLCDAWGISTQARVGTLSPSHVRRLTRYVQQSLVVGAELRKQEKLAVQRLVAVHCYRGLRHRRRLPVRGQRTHSNARTQRRLVRRDARFLSLNFSGLFIDGMSLTPNQFQQWTRHVRRDLRRHRRQSKGNLMHGQLLLKYLNQMRLKAPHSSSYGAVRKTVWHQPMWSHRTFLAFQQILLARRKQRLTCQGKHAVLHVYLGRKNTMVHLSTNNGQTLHKWSGGMMQPLLGKSVRKHSELALERLMEETRQALKQAHIVRLSVRIKGFRRPSGLRRKLVRMLKMKSLHLLSICDVTSLPYNGCRPPKQKRK